MLPYLDSDDLRQEIALAELQGVDPCRVLETLVRRERRRGRRTKVLAGVEPSDTSPAVGDSAAAVLVCLDLPPALAADVAEVYETGEYSANLRRRLRAVAQHRGLTWNT